MYDPPMPSTTTRSTASCSPPGGCQNPAQFAGLLVGLVFGQDFLRQFEKRRVQRVLFLGDDAFGQQPQVVVQNLARASSSRGARACKSAARNARFVEKYAGGIVGDQVCFFGAHGNPLFEFSFSSFVTTAVRRACIFV